MFDAPALLLQSAMAALPEHRVTSIFHPLTTSAQVEHKLALFVLTITAGIFVVVAGLLTYTLIRFRRRPGDDTRSEPPQVYGSHQIELAWTVIPVLIVFVLVGVTTRVISTVEDKSAPASALRATIIGHQFWWEIRYPDLGIVTANELHVPISATADQHPTFLRLESRDVIHSFWVPELGGKMYLIPNRTNSMWLDPREPGVYLGNCAEFCGIQHANMLLRVVVQPGDEFDRWAESQRKPAHVNPQTAMGRAMFMVCAGCHAVQGTPAKGGEGPDLTHFNSRQTIGAGVVPNTPENLRNWIKNPQAVKPGCLMPAMKLSDRQMNALMLYLQSLT